MAFLLPNGRQQFIDANGDPLVSGKVYFYIPDTTSPKDTWQDPDQASLNTNPVVLDDLGSAVIYGVGSYRQIVKDSTGTQLWDELTAAPDTLNSSWAGQSGGSANAQTVTLDGFDYSDGQVITFLIGLSNTGAMTLNPNGLGAIAVKKDTESGPADLVTGDIVVSNVASVVYDDTLGIFHLLTPSPVHQFDSAVYFNGFISPTILAADQNDWTPTGGYDGANTIRVSSTLEINITGLTTGTSGRTLIIHNVGSYPINFISESSASTAANRFLFAGPVTLLPNADFTIQYDSVSSRWRQFTGTDANPLGRCQLAKSSSNLVLSRFGGTSLFINGANQKIPVAGVTLSASGLSSSTLYYIYAYMSSGVMTLEASITAYTTDATYGVKVKTGDATRSLVGLAYTTSGAAFADTAAQRFVRSYFNDPGYDISNSFTTNRTSTSATYAEVNSEIRCEFLAWTGEIVFAAITGQASNASGGETAYTSIGFDGVTAENTYSGTSEISGGGQLATISCALNKSGLSEGYHYATLLGKVSASTGTWTGSASAGTRTAITGKLRL